MLGFSIRRKLRVRASREGRPGSAGSGPWRWVKPVCRRPMLASLVFTAAAGAIALSGEDTIDYVVNQKIENSIYAQVSFQVPDVAKTAADRAASQSRIPSYYAPNDRALTPDRIRADLMRVYQIAADADTFEAYTKALESFRWPADRNSYDELRRLADLPDNAGRDEIQTWVDALPIETQFVVQGLYKEPREPASTTEYILIETNLPDGTPSIRALTHSELVQQGSEKALQGSAALIARTIPKYELRGVVESVVLSAFRERPTIVFQRDRTLEAMKQAEENTPEAVTTFEKGKPIIARGVLDAEDYELLKAHHAAYLAYLEESTPEAAQLRQTRYLERAGALVLVILLSWGLMSYVRHYQPRLFESRWSTAAFLLTVTASLGAAKALQSNWPYLPELFLGPCLFLSSLLAIAYPRRFALGAACLAIVLTGAMLWVHVTLLLAALLGGAVTVLHLDEIRTRTKMIKVGLSSSAIVLVAAASGALVQTQPLPFVVEHTLWAGSFGLLSAFVLSGVLPFVERTFGVATSLTLLEWRDPTRPLLQLLAQEAPGTYNHSLVLGTLADAACSRIGANGLLAQVGALYHDVGKIHRASYFTENQEGRMSRHENLAPTMSLLIILGHVKDGLELARQYKVPPVLHQFIAEHHGTTVVRYFHQLASDKQPRVASGRHDRAVSEADFRYGGPKPRTRESAVLMLCDGVEGAVRSLQEPTVGRIEGTVHQIVMDRLSDGQFDDCDITLREIRLVEESLVKSLCGIYHGRVAYPKARKPGADRPARMRLSV